MFCQPWTVFRKPSAFIHAGPFFLGITRIIALGRTQRILGMIHPLNQYTGDTMKTSLASLTILLVGALIVSGGDRPLKAGEGSEHPKDGFISAEALSQWAGTSSFGGGFVQSSKLGDRAVHVIIRSFTSGMATSELSIYTARPDGKGVYRALFQPTRLVDLRARFADDSIIIEQYDQPTRKWVVCMTVTQSFFHDDTTRLR